jgi:hypothetical protein
MNYVSIKTSKLRPNLNNLAAIDVEDIEYTQTGKSSTYRIYFYTGSGERYMWEFSTKEERDRAYSNLPHIFVDDTKTKQV